MDILDDMGVSKLSAEVFFKVNYSFNAMYHIYLCMTPCVVQYTVYVFSLTLCM